MVVGILASIKEAGLTISIRDKFLLVLEPRYRITDNLRLLVREHKQEMVDALNATPEPCRNCEQREHLALAGELVVGCLYRADDEFSDGWRRIPDGLRRCMWHEEIVKLPVKKNANKQKGEAIPRADPGRVSPVALAWLRSNKAALRQAGWTPPKLYRRNKSRGIAWLELWGKPSLAAYLERGGVIRFEFIDDIGRGVTQRA